MHGRSRKSAKASGLSSWEHALSQLNDDVDERLRPDEAAFQKHQAELAAAMLGAALRSDDLQCEKRMPLTARLLENEQDRLSTPPVSQRGQTPRSSDSKASMQRLTPPQRTRPQVPAQSQTLQPPSRPWYLPFPSREKPSTPRTETSLMGSVNGVVWRRMLSVEEAMDDVEMPAREHTAAAAQRAGDATGKKGPQRKQQPLESDMRDVEMPLRSAASVEALPR